MTFHFSNGDKRTFYQNVPDGERVYGTRLKPTAWNSFQENGKPTYVDVLVLLLWAQVIGADDTTVADSWRWPWNLP